MITAKQLKALVCPSCGQEAAGGAGILVTEHINRPVDVSCGQCGDHGTVAYFTPAKPQVERIISRQIDVDPSRDDRSHVKAMAAAMDLFVQAAGEEGLDIRWDTFRMAAARDEKTGGVTFVAVVKTWERRHARDADDLKLISPAEVMYEMGFTPPSSTTTFTYTHTLSSS